MGRRPHKRRRRSSSSTKRDCDCPGPGGRDADDYISALPDEILLAILRGVDAKAAVGTSLLSRRWRHLWASLESLRLSEVSLPGDHTWVRLGPMRAEYLNTNRLRHFVPSLDWFAGMVRRRRHAGGGGGAAALRGLSLVFSGGAECADAVDAAISAAAEAGVREIDVAVVGKKRYEIPSSLFVSGDSTPSPLLGTLRLNNCKLSVSAGFQGFPSLTKLVLVAMHMSLKETQAVLSSCVNLRILCLIDMPAEVRALEHPKLEELVWLWPHPRGFLRIDAPALRRLEYWGAGEVLPASTARSSPCLEHVSLQFVVYGDHSEHHAKNLGGISTRFPHLKSLHLRYRVPKLVVRPGTPAIFSKLGVLTLSIETKPSDDLLWMAMFVVAAPFLATLQTNVRYLSFLESPNGVVWDDDSNFEHSSLKEVEMYNFKGRDNEIGFARLLLLRAPNLRRIAFSQARLCEDVEYQCIPPDWPKAQEFSPRDNQLVVSKLLDGISTVAQVLFM